MANYKITSDDTIHVYKVMPNTNQYGWHVFGGLYDSHTKDRLAAILLEEAQSSGDVEVINRMQKGSIRALRQCLRIYAA